MRENKTWIKVFYATCALIVTMVSGFSVKAQEVYANQIKDSTSDFRFAHRVVDTNKTNYAYISTAASLLSSSYIRVTFPASGKAGDVVNVTVQGSGQLLGAGLLNTLTLRLYDSSGAQVAVSSGNNDLELALLTDDSVYNIRYATNPAGTFKFKEARLELNNFLNVNVLSEFRIYGIYYQVPCPPVFADSVQAFGTNGILTGFVTDAGNAVDNNANNYATLTTPLNLLNLLPPAYLDLKFATPARTGEFVGFTVGQASALLNAGLLSSVEISLYDEAGVQRQVRNNFTTLDLRLIEGTVDRYVIGFTSQTGNYKIARIRIQLNSVLSLLQNIRVYNGFHYQLDRPPVPVTFSRSPIMCQGDNIVLTAEEVPGASGYLWSNGATTRAVIITQPGTYHVTVMDSFACSRRSVDIKVVVNSLPTPVIAGDTVLCGRNGGVLKTTVKYNAYLWGNSSNADSLAINNAAKYYVTVADSNSCMATDSVTVIRNQLNIVPSITNTTCNNNTTGSISVNVSGGSNNYSYRWNDGTTTSNLANMGAGIYTLIVKDNLQGCTYNNAYTITANNTLTFKSSVVNTSSCGAGDGQVYIDVVGGSGSYSFSWSNNSNARNLTNVKAGIYTVTATDSLSGCAATHTVVVSDGGNNLQVNPTIGHVSSCNLANGSINVSVSGGSGNYNYKWENNTAAANRSNLGAGKYYVIITDSATQCTYSGAIEVLNNAKLTIGGTITASACGKATGAINTNVTGGSNNYTYNWSDGTVATANRQNLSPGTYIVTITDNTTGCVGTKVFSVGTATSPTATLTVTQPSCATNNNGSINVKTSGNYIYSWSNGSNVKDQTGLKPGFYAVNITDTISNCMTNIEAMLNAYEQIKVVASPTSNTSCSTAPNGAINVYTTGGTSPYVYLWSNNDTTEDIGNLDAGSYSLDIDDINGCQSAAVVPVITDSAKLLNVAVDSIDLASCSTTANASLFINVAGGNAPYSYNWSNNDSVKDLMNVLPGNYSVVVTDSVGCTATLSIAVGIDSVNMLMLSVDSTLDALCSGSSTGAVYVSTSGGAGSYTYLWNNNAITEDLLNVAPNSYTLTVTDSLGCTAQVSATVPVDSAGNILLSVDSVILASCQVSADGSLFVNVVGGSGPYIYMWSNGATSKDLSNVTPGSYTLNVTDVNGCTAQLNTVLNADTANRLIITTATITDATCATSATGSVDVDVQGGKIPYNYSWSNGANTQDIVSVKPGNYTLNVTDAAGCTGQLGVNVGIDTTNPIVLTLDSLVNIGCIDSLSGAIYTSTSGGLAPYTYLWSDGNTAEDRINIAGGDYMLTVTDFVGCTDVLDVKVSDAALLVIDRKVTDVSCYGQSNGSILYTIGGSRSIIYSWSNGDTTNTVSNLSAGRYTVMITDNEYKCSLSDTFDISQPDSLLANAIITNDDCFINPTGKISVVVTGGTSPFTYDWSNGTTANELDGLEQGRYNVTITDNNNCKLTTGFDVSKDSCSYDIVVHDVITPNGDGVNDNWIIEGLQYYPNNVIYVFNKWGDAVFERKNYDGNWMGTNNKSENLADGTYYYLLKLNEANRSGGKNEFTGFLMIKR